MEKKRIAWLDAAKAIGILVVLLVHTGRSFGLVSYYGGMFYMPIFFVTAGMTFSYKPEESFGTFVNKFEIPCISRPLTGSRYFWLRAESASVSARVQTKFKDASSP